MAYLGAAHKAAGEDVYVTLDVVEGGIVKAAGVVDSCEKQVFKEGLQNRGSSYINVFIVKNGKCVIVVDEDANYMV